MSGSLERLEQVMMRVAWMRGYRWRRPLAIPLDWRSSRLPLLVGAALLGGTLLAAAASWLTGHEVPYRYAVLPSVVGTVPAADTGGAPTLGLFGLLSPSSPPPPSSMASVDPLAPPIDAEPDLIEVIDGRRLPRIAEDGRRSYTMYARSDNPAATHGPASIDIAILVIDLGLDAERMMQSIALPADIGLAQTPYAAFLADWQRHARRLGHEVMLELPLQADDHPASDLGPLALGPAQSPAELIDGIRQIADRSEAFLGFVAAGGAFATAPERFTPVAAELARRGLGLVELGEPLLAATATANGVAYANAGGPLDAIPDAGAIDAALARLEGLAQRDGRALAYIQPYPLTFDRIWHWARDLEDRGMRLVPVSRFLAEP